MICPFCNTENDDNAAVCINCGESLDTKEEAVLTTEDRKSQLEEIQARRLRKNQQKKRRKVILICLITAAVIAGACFGVYHLRSYIERTSTDKVVTVSATPTASPVATETPVPTETPSPTPTVTVAPTESATPAPTATPAAGWQTVAPDKESGGANAATKKPTPKKTKAPASKTSAPVIGTAAPAAPQTPATTKPVVSSPGFESSSATATDIPQGQSMTSQLITITEYITAPVTGREIVKFKVGNTSYFAYKPYRFSGTVNSTYIADAFVTSKDVFYGLPVYELVSIEPYSPSSEYILSQSSTKLLDINDISGMSKAQLKLARNEIFARHGRTFKNQELQNYFESKSWYKANPNYNYTNDYSNLSKTELKNALFLLEQENR